jgi:hypothetical protein
MHFWDWKSGYCFQKTETTVQPGSLDSEAGIFCSTFDKSGTRLITGEADKTIKIWKEVRYFVCVLISRTRTQPQKRILSNGILLSSVTIIELPKNKSVYLQMISVVILLTVLTNFVLCLSDFKLTADDKSSIKITDMKSGGTFVYFAGIKTVNGKAQLFLGQTADGSSIKDFGDNQEEVSTKTDLFLIDLGPDIDSEMYLVGTFSGNITVANTKPILFEYISQRVNRSVVSGSVGAKPKGIKVTKNFIYVALTGPIPKSSQSSSILAFSKSDLTADFIRKDFGSYTQVTAIDAVYDTDELYVSVDDLSGGQIQLYSFGPGLVEKWKKPIKGKSVQSFDFVNVGNDGIYSLFSADSVEDGPTSSTNNNDLYVFKHSANDGTIQWKTALGLSTDKANAATIDYPVRLNNMVVTWSTEGLNINVRRINNADGALLGETQIATGNELVTAVILNDFTLAVAMFDGTDTAVKVIDPAKVNSEPAGNPFFSEC